MSSCAPTSPVLATVRTTVALCLAAVALAVTATAADAAPGGGSLTARCSNSGDSGASWKRLNPDRVHLLWNYGPGGDWFYEDAVSRGQTSYYVPTQDDGTGLMPIRLTVTLYRGSRVLRSTETPCVA